MIMDVIQRACHFPNYSYLLDKYLQYTEQINILNLFQKTKIVASLQNKTKLAVVVESKTEIAVALHNKTKITVAPSIAKLG